MIKTKKQAKRAKVLFYKGKPCKKCGEQRRYTSTGNCVACLKERSAREYKEMTEQQQEAHNESSLDSFYRCKNPDI